MELQVGGNSAEHVYEQITAKGVSAADAMRIIGEWFVQTSTYTPRTFSYTPEPLAATEAQCTSAFAQTFFHDDWVDGVSVVQASKTAGEAGFNDRLHRIEHDLSSLGAELAKVFGCLGELRQSLSGLLAEVGAELNRIDSDLGRLFSRLDDATGPVSHPNVNSAFGQAVFVGTTKMFDQDVSLWSTSQGILTLPAVRTFVAGAVGNPQVSDPAGFAKFAADAKVIQAFAGGAVTPQDVVKRYGTTPLDNGRTVADAIKLLPDDASYATLADMTSALTQANAAVIRGTGAGQAVVAGSFSDLGAGVTTVADAAVGRLNAVPPDASAALAAAGIDTVGKLAAASPELIAKQLKTAGVSVTAGDVASWLGTARTLNQIGRVG